jgi:hypothetical protein
MACILVTSQSINYTCVARKLIYGLPSDLHFRSLTAVLTAECPEKTGKRPPGSVALNTHGGIPALKKLLSENIGYPQKIIVNHHFLHYSKLAIKQGHTPLPNKSQYGAGTIHLYQSTVHLGMARSIDPKTRMSSSYGHF